MVSTGTEWIRNQLCRRNWVYLIKSPCIIAYWIKKNQIWFFFIIRLDTWNWNKVVYHLGFWLVICTQMCIRDRSYSAKNIQYKLWHLLFNNSILYHKNALPNSQAWTIHYARNVYASADAYIVTLCGVFFPTHLVYKCRKGADEKQIFFQINEH